MRYICRDEKTLGDDGEDEILYSSANDRPKSAVKLEAVVNMIDQVKDEMNFFREKVCNSYNFVII
jgi:hypothetical protein